MVLSNQIESALPTFFYLVIIFKLKDKKIINNINMREINYFNIRLVQNATISTTFFNFLNVRL